MCGIAGVAWLRTDPPRSPDLAEMAAPMVEQIIHRGPNDGGIELLAGGRVALGNRRLAIRDLSPAGHMPMRSPDGRVCITYNGEVYNTADLRAELESAGYTFRSHSDTEVILHGYQAWGAGVVSRLRGMFAFAILDERQAGTPTLFLARDRLGIKPIFWARTAEAFVFGSELKAVVASGLVARRLEPAAVVGFLLLGSVTNPISIYTGVQALEPGCTLTLRPGSPNAQPEIRRYWQFPAESDTGIIDHREATARMRALLEEAVRIRLVSDVPLGAFLSGGLDSSAVVALMRRATTGTLRTCSMVFDESEYSEAPFAREMAGAVEAEHFERVVTAAELKQEWDRMFRAMDQPTVDGINTYFVSQTARQAGLTVALSGLGGDELFGGYPNTFGGVPQMLRLLARVRSLPGGPALASVASRLPRDQDRWAKARDALGRRSTPASAYLARRGLFAPSEVRGLLNPEVWAAGAAGLDPVAHIAQRADAGGGGALFEWVSRAELSVYTHHQLLRDTDAMSMAHSLEVRVPLLDHLLVEAALRLPAVIKQAGTGPKPLLVAALGDLLPPAIRDRQEKRGFTFPFAVWMGTTLREHLETALEQATGLGLLQPKAVHALWAGFRAGRVHWSRPWSLAALGAWSHAAGLTHP